MSQVISVQVQKEAYELGQGVAKFVGDLKQALSDGWQPGQDLPAILQATMADLIPAIQGVEKLGPELKENSKAFVNSFALSGIDMAFVFVPKGA